MRIYHKRFDRFLLSYLVLVVVVPAVTSVSEYYLIGNTVTGWHLALWIVMGLALCGVIQAAHEMMQSVIAWWKRPSPYQGGFTGTGAGNRSEITTDTLAMQLDHATGDLEGQVLRGRFAGRSLMSLKLAELAALLAECQRDDPRSVGLVEAYLERRDPDWRDHVEQPGHEHAGDDHEAAGDYGKACKILELPEDCDEATFKRRLRELRAKIHPDQGGSTVLAQMVNAAADTIRSHRQW